MTALTVFEIENVEVKKGHVYYPVSLPKMPLSDSITVVNEQGHLEFVLARDIKEIRTQVRDIKDFLIEKLEERI